MHAGIADLFCQCNGKVQDERFRTAIHTVEDFRAHAKDVTFANQPLRHAGGIDTATRPENRLSFSGHQKLEQFFVHDPGRGHYFLSGGAGLERQGAAAVVGDCHGMPWDPLVHERDAAERIDDQRRPDGVDPQRDFGADRPGFPMDAVALLSGDCHRAPGRSGRF